VLSVPLVARGKAVGVMNAAYFTDHVVAPREIELVQAAGAHFAAAVETERLVTDLRRSYADLARAQAQLVERERLAAIGELAAVVAHEVRNPLGVLFNSLGSLRKLLGADVAGPAATLLEIMDEEATRLNHIVRDLLDFARPTPPALSRDNLEAVVEEAVDAALGEARGRVELVREIGELPLVPMDARLVRQALLNLVDNAVQAMPRGGRLTVRLGADEMGATRAARLEIEDTGPGIAPDVERRIFEPFFTTRASGTGLGLAVVKRIVDGHRGLLRVDTVEGRGTTFTVWLPLDDDGPRSAPGGEGEIPLRG
jgi:signal transduction histidine kinase